MRVGWKTPPDDYYVFDRHCKECGAELKHKRGKFCRGGECAETYFIRFDWTRLRPFVLKRDENKCVLCGREGTQFARGATSDRPALEVDHIIPISDGGDQFDPDNCRTLCQPCHKRVTADWHREKALKRIEGQVWPLRGRTAQLVAGQTAMDFK